MMDPAEKALVSFSFSGERSAAAAADSFLARSGARVLKRESTRVNGVPAVALESSATSRDLEVRILSYFIVLDGKIYAFHGFTYSASWGEYVAGFREIMTGFERLTSARIIAVKPERIRLRQAPNAGNLESVLREMGYGDKRLSELALLNGRNLTDLVDKGEWLKTVSK
jgi:predicted Zn-dependent protease